jgi:hypothetical protein
MADSKYDVPDYEYNLDEDEENKNDAVNNK